MAQKFDGVIEAVRYENGKISVVRLFERRGATFSDRLLMSREDLLRLLKKKRKFVVGKRKELLAGTFEVGSAPLQVLNRDGREIIATRPNAEQDELEGAPVF